MMLWRAARSLCFALSLWSAAAANSVAAQGDSALLSGGGGEHYIVALPPQWVVNGQTRNAKGAASNWVPRDQIGEDWRRLISLQIFTDLADNAFTTYFDGIIQRYRAICDDVFATAVEENRRNDFPVAFRILACTKSARNGLGEISLFHVVAGKQALYVVQGVYRVQPFGAQDFPLAGEELQRGRQAVEFGVACQRGDPMRACPVEWLAIIDALGAAPPIVAFPAEND